MTYGDADGAIIDQLQADPLLSQIPAIASGAIAVLENSTPLAASANPSPLSIGWGIDEYFALLAAPPAEHGSVTVTHDACTAPDAARPAASGGGAAWPGSRARCSCSRCCASPRSPSARAIVTLDDDLRGLSAATERASPRRPSWQRMPRTVLALLVGAALGARRRRDAGRHPQPARRPRHPRRQRAAPRWPS